MPAQSHRGRFVWHELLTTDTKAAEGFFTKVVGWNAKPFDQSYTLFLTGKQNRAGLMALPAEAKAMGAPPHWESYVAVPNVDESAKQATALGGKVLKAPTDIPNVGRFAVLQDPQGATFAIFKGTGDMPIEEPPAVGDFSWHELATSDWKGALAFYKNLFGWQETNSMDMGPQGTYQMFGLDGKTMGGMYNVGPEHPGGRSWLPYIKVPDAKKTAATITKLGAKVINGPMEVPGGDMIAQGLDLQGIPFAVHSVTAKAAAASKPASKPASRPAKKKAAKKAKPAKRAAAKKRPAARKKAAKRKPAKKSKRAGGRRR
jgi:uncharacterized protein